MSKSTPMLDMNRPSEIIRTWRKTSLFILTIISAYMMYQLPLEMFYMSATSNNPLTNTNEPPTSFTKDSDSITQDEPSSNSPSTEGSSSRETIFHDNPMTVNKWVKCRDCEVTNIQLVMMWPPGYCTTQVTCWQEIDMAKFYIHGLWPADDEGYNREGCKLLFNAALFSAQLEALGEQVIQRLHDKWPSFQRVRWFENQRAASPGFWKHEYLRHDSCAEISFNEYFSRVLEKSDLKIENLLFDAGMLADTNPVVNYDIFSRAFNPLIGNKNFYLSCVNGDILAEIIFCLDKEAQSFISCPDIANPNTDIKTSCTKAEAVTFHKRETF